MATEISKGIICPQCGQQQKYNLCTSVNSDEMPELKEYILSETFFDWRCDHCNYFANMAYPFFYIDPTAGYAICVNQIGKNNNFEPTPAFDNFIKRQVRSIAELKEKILTFDAGFDDVAIEIVKNALCATIRNTYKTTSAHAYFSRENNDELEFAVFLPNRKDPVYHSTSIDIYEQSKEVLRALNYIDPKDFSVVNAKLAHGLLEQYKN